MSNRTLWPNGMRLESGVRGRLSSYESKHSIIVPSNKLVLELLVSSSYSTCTWLFEESLTRTTSWLLLVRMAILLEILGFQVIHFLLK